MNTIPKKVPFFIRFIQRTSVFINKFSEITGVLVSYLVLIIMLIIVYDVSMRFLYNQGSVLLQELQWHLFALIFLLGAAYTLKHDEHVRVDIFYQSDWVTDRMRAWINLLGSLLFLLPFCIFIIIASFPSVKMAYLFNEGSPDPGGLPYRFLLKAAIPVGFSLLTLQGIADASTQLLYLLGYPITNERTQQDES